MQARATMSCLFLTLAAACSSSTGPNLDGSWGGPEASLTLGPSGGSVQYACGAGTIDADWSVSHNGRFRAAGLHYFGGGPLPVRGGSPHPARYDGALQGDQLSFTVTLTDQDVALGPYLVVRDGPIVPEICL